MELRGQERRFYFAFRGLRSRQCGLAGSVCVGLYGAVPGAELTAFSCLLLMAIGPAKAHVDKKGIIDGLWRGEMRLIGPRAKDAD